MRDIETDGRTGKNTLPLRMGFAKAKIYQSFLLIAPFVLGLIYIISIGKTEWFHFTFLLLFIPAILLVKKINQTKEPRLLDSELKKVALLTLAFSLILGISLNF